MCREFNCKSNGSFRNENGVGTRKLGPKRRKQNMAVALGDIARDYAILAMSRGAPNFPSRYLTTPLVKLSFRAFLC